MKKRQSDGHFYKSILTLVPKGTEVSIYKIGTNEFIDQNPNDLNYFDARVINWGSSLSEKFNKFNTFIDEVNELSYYLTINIHNFE